MTCHSDPVPFWCPLDPAFVVTGWAIFGDAVANILGESSAGVRAGDSGLHTTVRRMHCMRS